MKPALRFGAAYFVLIFVVLSSLVVLFALFPEQRQKRLLKIIHHILIGGDQAKLFSNKVLSLKFNFTNC